MRLQPEPRLAQRCSPGAVGAQVPRFGDNHDIGCRKLTHRASQVRHRGGVAADRALRPRQRRQPYSAELLSAGHSPGRRADATKLDNIYVIQITTQNKSRRMRRLLAAGLLPDRAGQPTRAWAHISLADLLAMDGDSRLQEARLEHLGC